MQNNNSTPTTLASLKQFYVHNWQWIWTTLIGLSVAITTLWIRFEFLWLLKTGGSRYHQIAWKTLSRHTSTTPFVQAVDFNKMEGSMAFFDVSTRALRSALKPRRKPYYHRIIPNHHVGVFVSESNGAFWVSRVRAEKGGYASRSLGRATLLGPDGTGGGRFGFKTALKKAEEFRLNQHKKGVAASPFNLWYYGQMTICPVGDVIT